MALAAIVVCASPVVSLAADSAVTPAGGSDVATVEGVVVAPSKSERKASQTGESVTVITGEVIARDQELDLASIVSRTPGVSMSRNGGPGQTTSLFLRGADSGDTFVLLDGVKLNDPASPSTGYDFASLITGVYARVEVLRGSQSTLYGSEAIGGVVSMTTADPSRPLEAHLRAEVGGLGSSFAALGLGGRERGFFWRVEGYLDSAKGSPCFEPLLGGRRPCAFHNNGASAALGVDLLPNLKLIERAYYVWTRTDFDGYDTPTYSYGDDGEFGHFKQWISYTGLDYTQFQGRLHHQLSFQYSANDRTDSDPAQPANFGVDFSTTFESRGRTSTIEYQGTWRPNDRVSGVFGAESQRSTMVAFAPLYDPAPNRGVTTINSGFVRVMVDPTHTLSLSGGLRISDQTGVGSHVGGQAALAWRPFAGTVLRASFGQGFKAPSLYELYSEYGNQALKPETSNSWDVGVEQKLGAFELSLGYFGRSTSQLVNFVSCYSVPADFGLCPSHPFGGYYDNIGKAYADGVEVHGAWRPVNAFAIVANYTHVRSEDRSTGSPTYGKQLARRPRDSGDISANYTWTNGATTDLALRLVGDSFDDGANLTPLKAFAVLDLRASYPIRNRIELYGRIENLTDAHYETAYLYGNPGRVGYVGVRARF
jgi:vitamin B12 transporter